MNGEFYILLGTYLLVAALMIAHPWFARKNVLFGVVFGSADIWSAPEAKAGRRRYLTQAVILALAIAAALAVYYAALRPAGGVFAGVFSGAMLLMIVLEMIPFVLAHRRAKEYKASLGPDQNLVHDQITVETSLEEGKAVASALWLLLLLPLLLADVLIAVLGYDRIPAQFPIHYGLHGPDAWAVKTAATVAGSVLMDVFMTAIIVVSVLFTRRAPASVRGNPQAAPDSVRYRRWMVAMLAITGVFLQGTFVLMRLGMFVELPMLLLNLVPFAVLLPVAVLFYIYFRYARPKHPKGKILDDDAKWVLGMFYYNPSDPAIFVEKRVGIGFTLNFARPLGWVFILGVLAIVLCSTLLF